MLCAGVAMGMPNSPIAQDIDTWYSIEDEKPFFSGGFTSAPDASSSSFTGEYYQNDFFFLTGFYADDVGSMSMVTGSYIFDSGFFVALVIENYTGATYYTLSPGYCRAWDEGGYLAFSLDYDSEYGVEGLDVDLEYRADALLIRGELYIDEDFDYYGIEASLAFRVGEELTIGGEIELEDGSLDDLEVGATWKPGSWVFDLRVDEDYDYDLNCVYYFGAFGLGLEYNGDLYSLKAKYDTGDSRFTMFFRPEQDWVLMNYELSFTMFF